MKVLLVDDDPVVQSAYGRMLRALGCEVLSAGRADEALKLLTETVDIDVIVTDITMPGGDGITLLRETRKIAPDLPVILITGFPDVSSAAASVEHGAFRYLTKPVDPEVLKIAVRTAAEVHQLAKLRRQAIEFVESDPAILIDRSTLEDRFTAALEKLWIAYQPIVKTSEMVVSGFEALVRSRETSMPHPGVLFDAAERLGRLHELGRQIRDRVAALVPSAPKNVDFFVNLHAADLNDPSLYAPASALTKIASRVVLEITERRSLEQVTEVSGRIKELRKLGFRIAVDDLGAGYAGLSSFGQLEPDIVKLDMSLVRGIDASPRRQSLVASMIALCRNDLGIEVVCEGVETEGERDTLARVHCDLMQGYLFAKPAPELSRLDIPKALAPVR